jgi:serine/threonine protein phosphatase PrpC
VRWDGRTRSRRRSPAKSLSIPCSAFFRERKPSEQDNAYLDDAPLGARLLAEAVKKANDAILAYAEENKNTSGMGTTLVAVRFADGRIQHCQCGR